MIPRLAQPEDSDLLTMICSHPDVRNWTAQDTSPPFDPSKWFQGENFAVLCDGGAFLFHWLGDGIYGVHTNFLPEARGKKAFVAGNLTLLMVFTQMKVETIHSAVPQGNRMADSYARGMGFRPTFRQNHRWLKDGRLEDLNYFRLDIDDWIQVGLLKSVGEAFHEELSLLGHDTHGSDAVHDAYVGAACSMLVAGQQIKALKIYNRWARLAGYQPLTFVSQVPLEIDAGTFLVALEGGRLRIKAKEANHA